MLTILANAKINLFLSILDRRPDGYHNIVSVLQSICLSDRLSFTPTKEETAIVYRNAPAADFEDDLVARAAQLIAEKTGLTKQTRIEVIKEIPVAAGLGGGSSDAAATLVGLNRLYELNLARPDLRELAENLGADVPFFIQGGTQLAQGKGEKLEVLEALPSCSIVVAAPPLKASTRKMYEDFDRLQPRVDRDPTVMLDAIKARDLEGVSKELFNAFEMVAGSTFPQVLEMKRRAVAAGAAGALMSGSGVCLFALASTEAEARRIGAALDDGGSRMTVTRPCQRALEIIE